MHRRAVASNIIDMSPHELGTSMQKFIEYARNRRGTSAPCLLGFQCSLDSGFGYTRLRFWCEVLLASHTVYSLKLFLTFASLYPASCLRIRPACTFLETSW